MPKPPTDDRDALKGKGAAGDRAHAGGKGDADPERTIVHADPQAIRAADGRGPKARDTRVRPSSRKGAKAQASRRNRRTTLAQRAAALSAARAAAEDDLPEAERKDGQKAPDVGQAGPRAATEAAGASHGTARGREAGHTSPADPPKDVPSPAEAATDAAVTRAGRATRARARRERAARVARNARRAGRAEGWVSEQAEAAGEAMEAEELADDALAGTAEQAREAAFATRRRLSESSTSVRLGRRTVRRLERSGATRAGIERRLEAEASRRAAETSRHALFRRSTTGVRRAASYRTVTGKVVAGTGLRTRLRSWLQGLAARAVGAAAAPALLALAGALLGVTLVVAAISALPGLEDEMGTTDYSEGNQTVVSAAYRMLSSSSRYLYGGGGDMIYGDDPNFDTDCSGLVAWCYNQAGVRVDHDSGSYPYDSRFEEVPKEQAVPGDVLWWGSSTRHVGIYVGRGDDGQSQSIEHYQYATHGPAGLRVGQLESCERVYHYKAWSGTVGGNSIRQQIVATAMTQLNAKVTYRNDSGRFQWGVAMDCSGFTYLVFKKCGIDIPPCQSTRGGGTNSQVWWVHERNWKTRVEDLEVGDLVFTGSTTDTWDSRTPGHVGIYIGNGKMIDCVPRPGSYSDVGTYDVITSDSPSWRHFIGGGWPV